MDNLKLVKSNLT